MYTLLELQTKTLRELKNIGQELNVLPEGDRRYRETWINAIAGVNPPLLQLLEVFPGVEVESVQEPIIETVKSSPAAEAEHVQDLPIESKFGRIVYPKSTAKPISQNEEARPHFDRIEGANVHNLGFHPAKSDRDSGGAKNEALGSQEGDRVLAVARDGETGRGRVLPDQSIQLVNQAQEPIAGVDLIDDEFPECCNCFGDGYTENQFGSIKFCPQCKTEPILSHQKTQRAIALAAKFSLDPKFDRNPILTGISLSDRFIARYSPPQSYNICFQADTDGQLSLLDFEVELVNEPPDPDDFPSIDAFNDAMARWDAENAESLTVSMDSMCEWAPCPHEWYEPKAENLPLKASSRIEVVELSTGSGSSITCNFSIPTFGAWCDRSDRSDEPPDTGFLARSPKPKPPPFSPQASHPKSAQVSQTSRNYPETIPRLFHRVAAGSSTQPARSPPGGDARRGQ